MANTSTITRFSQNEDATADTPIVALFPRFLDALSEFIEAERDLQEVDDWDPAFSGWLQSSERAKDKFMDLQRAILAKAARSPAERSIKLATFFLKLATLAEDAGRIAQFRNLIYRRGEELMIEERCEGDQQFNRRMRGALILFDRFLSLDLYQPAGISAHSAQS